jgi:hypothetical protein
MIHPRSKLRVILEGFLYNLHWIATYQTALISLGLLSSTAFSKVPGATNRFCGILVIM